MTDPRERLAELRKRTLAQITDLEAEVADVIASASSTTGDDEHDPEGATVGFERAQAQALLDAARMQLVDVDAALARVADGRYGICVDCGLAIGTDRLDARPTALRCIACATRR